MNTLTFVAHSEQETQRLGRALAELLPRGTVVALCGPLGAGKTRLVQAVAEVIGVPREAVTSPTFVLHQQYTGTRTIHHFDVYRIADEDEFLQLGPEEYFESGELSFVEWADRVGTCLPDGHLRIDIDVPSPQTRNFSIRAEGAPLESLLLQLQKKLPASRID